MLVPPLHAVLRPFFLAATVPRLMLVTGTAPPPPTLQRCSRGIYWIIPTFQGTCYMHIAPRQAWVSHDAYDAVVFIPLLCSFAFVSGNEIADQKSHIIVVCIFIILGHTHYFP